jgi:hypothetical protein
MEHVKNSTLVQFCIKMLLNLQIKNQIMSLKLPKKDMCGVIETLLSFVSLNELSQLRSLTLGDLNGKTASQISFMLPLLNNLRHFRMTDPSFFEIKKILTSLPISTIQTLSIPTLPDGLTLTHPFTSLVNLTVSCCPVEKLCDFFRYSPNLQYLTIERIYRLAYRISDKLHPTSDHAVYLKRLIIHHCRGEFELLEIVLKRVPNLEFLMISDAYNIDIVDPCRWQNLITTSLSHLDVFKFKFSFLLGNNDSDIVDKFQQFQNDFWHEQHHWYTEYKLDNYAALIYTVPCISNEYEITPYTKRGYNESMNNMNTFANVRDLTLCPEAITDIYQYHFSNVKSLRLSKGHVDDNHVYPFFKKQHVQCLKTIVNLCNLTHLDISLECRLKSSSVLLHLLQETPHILSLKINKDTLFSLFNNRELCECFNKMIKKLDITGFEDYTFLGFDKIVKVCEIFSNMEEFRCDIDRPENFQLILNHLSKLSHMKAFVYKTPYSKYGNSWLNDYLSDLELYSFTIKRESYYDDDEDDDDNIYFNYYNDYDYFDDNSDIDW